MICTKRRIANAVPTRCKSGAAERNDAPVVLKLKNLLGGSLKEIDTFGNKLKMDCSNFSKGIYLLEINTENKIITKKLIIN